MNYIRKVVDANDIPLWGSDVDVANFVEEMVQDRTPSEQIDYLKNFMETNGIKIPEDIAEEAKKKGLWSPEELIYRALIGHTKRVIATITLTKKGYIDSRHNEVDDLSEEDIKDLAFADEDVPTSMETTVNKGINEIHLSAGSLEGPFSEQRINNMMSVFEMLNDKLNESEDGNYFVIYKVGAIKLVSNSVDPVVKSRFAEVPNFDMSILESEEFYRSCIQHGYAIMFIPGNSGYFLIDLKHLVIDGVRIKDTDHLIEFVKSASGIPIQEASIYKAVNAFVTTKLIERFLGKKQHSALVKRIMSYFAGEYIPGVVTKKIEEELMKLMEGDFTGVEADRIRSLSKTRDKLLAEIKKRNQLIAIRDEIRELIKSGKTKEAAERIVAKKYNDSKITLRKRVYDYGKLKLDKNLTEEAINELKAKVDEYNQEIANIIASKGNRQGIFTYTGSGVLVNAVYLDPNDPDNAKYVEEIFQEQGINSTKYDYLGDGALVQLPEVVELHHALTAINDDAYGFTAKFKIVAPQFLGKSAAHSATGKLEKWMRQNNIGAVFFSSTIKLSNQQYQTVKISDILEGKQIENQDLVFTHNVLDQIDIPQATGSPVASVGGLWVALLSSPVIYAMATKYPEFSDVAWNLVKELLAGYEKELADLGLDPTEDNATRSKKMLANIKEYLSQEGIFENNITRFLRTLTDDDLSIMNDPMIMSYYVETIVYSKLLKILQLSLPKGSITSSIMTPDLGLLSGWYDIVKEKYGEAHAANVFHENSHTIKEDYILIDEQTAKFLGITDEMVKNGIATVFVINIPIASYSELRPLKVGGIVENTTGIFNKKKVGKNFIVSNIKQMQYISGKDYDIDRLMIINTKSSTYLEEMWRMIKKANLQDKFEEEVNKYINPSYRFLDVGVNREAYGKTLGEYAEYLKQSGYPPEIYEDLEIVFFTAYFGSSTDELLNKKALNMYDPNTHGILNTLFQTNELGRLFNIRLLYSTMLDYIYSSKTSGIETGSITKNGKRYTIKISPNMKDFERNNIILTKLFSSVVDWHSDFRLFFINYSTPKLFSMLFDIYVLDKKDRWDIVDNETFAYALYTRSKFAADYSVLRALIRNKNYDSAESLVGMRSLMNKINKIPFFSIEVAQYIKMASFGYALGTIGNKAYEIFQKVQMTPKAFNAQVRLVGETLKTALIRFDKVFKELEGKDHPLFYLPDIITWFFKLTLSSSGNQDTETLPPLYKWAKGLIVSEDLIRSSRVGGNDSNNIYRIVNFILTINKFLDTSNIGENGAFVSLFSPEELKTLRALAFGVFYSIYDVSPDVNEFLDMYRNYFYLPFSERDTPAPFTYVTIVTKGNSFVTQVQVDPRTKAPTGRVVFYLVINNFIKFEANQQISYQGRILSLEEAIKKGLVDPETHMFKESKYVIKFNSFLDFYEGINSKGERLVESAVEKIRQILFAGLGKSDYRFPEKMSNFNVRSSIAGRYYKLFAFSKIKRNKGLYDYIDNSIVTLFKTVLPFTDEQIERFKNYIKDTRGIPSNIRQELLALMEREPTSGIPYFTIGVILKFISDINVFDMRRGGTYSKGLLIARSYPFDTIIGIKKELIYNILSTLGIIATTYFNNKRYITNLYKSALETALEYMKEPFAYNHYPIGSVFLMPSYAEGKDKIVPYVFLGIERGMMKFYNCVENNFKFDIPGGSMGMFESYPLIGASPVLGYKGNKYIMIRTAIEIKAYNLATGEFENKNVVNEILETYNIFKELPTPTQEKTGEVITQEGGTAPVREVQKKEQLLEFLSNLELSPELKLLANTGYAPYTLADGAVGLRISEEVSSLLGLRYTEDDFVDVSYNRESLIKHNIENAKYISIDLTNVYDPVDIEFENNLLIETMEKIIADRISKNQEPPLFLLPSPHDEETGKIMDFIDKVKQKGINYKVKIDYSVSNGKHKPTPLIIYDSPYATSGNPLAVLFAPSTKFGKNIRGIEGIIGKGPVTIHEAIRRLISYHGVNAKNFFNAAKITIKTYFFEPNPNVPLLIYLLGGVEYLETLTIEELSKGIPPEYVEYYIGGTYKDAIIEAYKEMIAKYTIKKPAKYTGSVIFY